MALNSDYDAHAPGHEPPVRVHCDAPADPEQLEEGTKNEGRVKGESERGARMGRASVHVRGRDKGRREGASGEDSCCVVVGCVDTSNATIDDTT